MKVKVLLFTHPQWHLMLASYKVISPNYILSRIELEAKGYGEKNSITNFMNQLSCTLDAINVLSITDKRGLCCFWCPNKT
jgi:hypothetical protein